MSRAEPRRATRARTFGGPANPHLGKVEERFGPTIPAALPALDGVEVVFICFTNRCGSNFLCEALASTGRINVGREALNWPAILSAAEAGGHDSLHDTLDAMFAPSIRDGRFAVKAGAMHLDLLRRAGILDPILQRARFVHIARADRLAQAISFEIARQTQAWAAVDADGPSRAAEARFDRRQIDVVISALCEGDHQLARFYSVNGIVPVHVLYEQLVADPAAEIARIGPLIGLDGLGYDPARVRLRRQSSPVNTEWRARYLADD